MLPNTKDDLLTSFLAKLSAYWDEKLALWFEMVLFIKRHNKIIPTTLCFLWLWQNSDLPTIQNLLALS